MTKYWIFYKPPGFFFVFFTKDISTQYTWFDQHLNSLGLISFVSVNFLTVPAYIAHEMYWGLKRAFLLKLYSLDFLSISLLSFLGYAKVWFLEHNLNLFGLNDKLVIHTVRTRVINYNRAFFIQNSCWGNRGSSDCLEEGGGKQGTHPLLVLLLGLLTMTIRARRGQKTEERETINFLSRWLVGNAH